MAPPSVPTKSPSTRVSIGLRCIEPECQTYVVLQRTEPVSRVGALTHCPMCGGRALQKQFSTDEATLEAYAYHLNLPPKLVEQCYELWRDEHCPGNFFDFVRSM